MKNSIHIFHKAKSFFIGDHEVLFNAVIRCNPVHGRFAIDLNLCRVAKDGHAWPAPAYAWKTDRFYSVHAADKKSILGLTRKEAMQHLIEHYKEFSR